MRFRGLLIAVVLLAALGVGLYFSNKEKAAEAERRSRLAPQTPAATQPAAPPADAPVTPTGPMPNPPSTDTGHQ